MQRIAREDLQHILTNTLALWPHVRNKSIFLTGATGFFGKWILESFLYANKELSLNATISALSRDPRTFLDKYPFFQDSSINFIKGDIQTFDFPHGDFHFIIHAATEADAFINQSQPLRMVDTITLGTRRILDFAIRQRIESFLFTSSGAVYGRQPADITHIKENEYFSVDINNPNSAYAEGKRLAELYCSIYHLHYKLPVKIARGFAFVGPYLPLDKHFAIGNFLSNALNGEDITIKGDGSPYRSYLYASDMAIWLWTILVKGESGVPYNVGSDEGLALQKVAEVVKGVGTGINVNILTGRDSSRPIERYVPNIDLAKKTLGLGVTIDLKKAIEKTLRFYGNL